MSDTGYDYEKSKQIADELFEPMNQADRDMTLAFMEAVHKYKTGRIDATALEEYRILYPENIQDAAFKLYKVYVHTKLT